MITKNRIKFFAVIIVLALMFAVFTACADNAKKNDEGTGDQNNKIENTESQSDKDSDNTDDQENQQDTNAKDENNKNQNEASSFPVEITDVLGRTVTIKEQPKKIVSITPSTTEVLFALGLNDEIVGVSEQCDYPEEAASKEKAGAFWEPNLEKIVSLEPDVVFVGNKIKPELLEKLEEAKITAISLEATSFDDIPQSILDAGKVVGKEKEAEATVKSMENKVNEIEDTVKDGMKDADKPNCYFIISHSDVGNYTAGPGSFIDDMIKLAGGNNIAGDLDQQWPEYSIEKLVEKDPEVVMIGSNSNPDGVKDAEGYKELKTIKEGKLIVIEDDLVTLPGPRIVEGLEKIAKAIHPDLFK